MLKVDRTARLLALGCALTCMWFARPASAQPFNCNCTISGTTTVCEGEMGVICVPDNGLDGGPAATYAWSAAGNVMIVGPADGFCVTYVGTAGGAGSLTIMISRPAPASCSCTSTANITVVAAPIVDVGMDQSLCTTAATVSFNATSSNTTSCLWTTNGSGTFDDATSPTATYTFDPGDGALVYFVYTCSGNSPCTPVFDDLNVYRTTAPTVNAGNDSDVCSNSSIMLGGSGSDAASYLWSGGTGSFDDATLLNATYTPGLGEAGPVVLTLTAFGNFPCADESDTVTITVVTEPTVSAGTDDTVCTTQASYALSGSSTNTSSCLWTGGAGTFDDATNPLTNYNFDPGDGASVMLTLTCQGNSPCAAVSASVTISRTAAPTVSAGDDSTICSNGVASLNGSGTNAAGYLWTGGLGTFGDSSNPITTYTPDPSEAGATVTLTLQAYGNSPCADVSDTVDIEVVAEPTVDAGQDDTVCTTLASYALAGSSTNTTTCMWSGGTGSFVNATDPTTTYTFGGGDGASVTLTLTCDGNTPCASVMDSVTITRIDAPTVDAGMDTSSCSNGMANLNGSGTNAVSYSWSGGAGVFGDASNPMTTYTPHPSESGTVVTLTLTASGAPPCDPVFDTVDVTVVPQPTVDAGPDQSVCDGGTANLFGGGSQNSGYLWSGGLGTFGDPTSAMTTYTPDASEAGTTVTLTLTALGNPPCANTSDTVDVTVLVNPNCTITAASPICGTTGWAGYVASVNPNTVGPYTYSWSVTAGGAIVGPSNGSQIFYGSDGSNSPFTINVSITDGNNCSCNGSFNVTIDPTPQDGKLILEIASPPADGCYGHNEDITVNVYMRDMTCPVAGFEAFLGFDNTKIEYRGGSYTMAPFNLPSIDFFDTNIGTPEFDPVSLHVPAYGEINLANGIDVGGINGPAQVPSSADALLATLNFRTRTSDTCPTDLNIYYRAHNPPTRFTDLDGVSFEAANGLDLIETGNIRIDTTAPILTSCNVQDATVDNGCCAVVNFSAEIEDACCIDAMTGVISVNAAIAGGMIGGGVNSNLVTNPGFETGDFTDWAQFGSGFFDGVTSFYAHGGIAHAFFGEVGGLGGIQQVIPANAGDTVDVSFWLLNLGGTPNQAQVTFDGNVLLNIVNGPSDPDYVFYTYTVLVTNNNPVLQFAFQHDPNFWLLDDVSVVRSGPSCQGLEYTVEQVDGDTIRINGSVGVTGLTTCPATVTLSYVTEDCCGNRSATLTCTDVGLVTDTIDPEITCPPDQHIYVVDTANCEANVNVGTPTVTDNCSATYAGVRSDARPLTDPYPIGDTTITWTATDICGNTDVCTQNIHVDDAVYVDVTVELSPTMVAGPLNRCISFEFLDSNCNVTTASADIVFNNGLSGTTTITVSPCRTYTCAMARDKHHTLRRSATPTFNVGTGRWEASWVGDVNLGGDWLVGGNLNDDQYIDILDFGIWAGLYLTNYGTGDTYCPVSNPPRHADINGDGLVDMADFTFIMINFLQFREASCCVGPFADDQNVMPNLSISVKELLGRGEYEMARADLNGDGMVDMFDIVEAAINGVPPPPVDSDDATPPSESFPPADRDDR